LQDPHTFAIAADIAQRAIVPGIEQGPEVQPVVRDSGFRQRFLLHVARECLRKSHLAGRSFLL
jgi:hypothetical protein